MDDLGKVGARCWIKAFPSDEPHGLATSLRDGQGHDHHMATGLNGFLLVHALVRCDLAGEVTS